MKNNRIVYILSKFRYDTFIQVFLDAFKFINIRINPYLIFLEGLKLTPSEFQNQKPKGIEFSYLNKEHIPQLLGFPDRTESLEILNTRIDHGDICIAAWSGGKIVAFSWADLIDISFPPYLMPLIDNEAYLYDAYTTIEFRGKRIADILRYYLYEELAKKNKFVLYSVSQRFNPPAIRFKRKLGAMIVDSGISIMFFGRWEFKSSTHAQRIRLMASRVCLESKDDNKI